MARLSSSSTTSSSTSSHFSSFHSPRLTSHLPPLTSLPSILKASRASGISTDKDARRAAHAGKEATISKVDPSDGTVKLRVMVALGRAEELCVVAGDRTQSRSYTLRQLYAAAAIQTYLNSCVAYHSC